MGTVFRLSELLERMGISQSELARRAGVALRTVARLCRNETAQVSLATLDKLAAALGVEPGELIAREKRRRADGKGPGRGKKVPNAGKVFKRD